MPFKYNALLGLGLDNTIPLDGAGKIPSTFLPSYVDDVEEYNNLAAFPATGETGKIYVAIDTGFVYRWSGSVYVQIGITAAAGSTTQVQFNDGGAFGGDSGLTFDKTTDALSAGGFIPTSSTVPANGIYLPAANSVAVATNGVQRINIDSSGRLLVGTSTARTNFFNSTFSTVQQIEGTGTSSSRSSLAIVNNSTAAGGGPYLILAKSNGSAVGSNTISVNGEIQGFISFQGNDGADFVECAQILAAVDGTPGSNSMPGRIIFSTTANGAASATERMRITSAGVLQIADAGNITVGTTTGTKIGTATTQKIGFYNATPVVQPAAVANATTAVDVITQLNDLLAKLRTLGIIAT